MLRQHALKRNIPSTILIIGAAFLTLGEVGQFKCLGATYELRFIGEDRKPINDAQIFLYELNNGEFLRAIYRAHPLAIDSTISIEQLPREFEIGIVSKSHYYEKWWKSSETKLEEGLNILQAEQSGTVEVTFLAASPAEDSKDIRGPFVLPYYRRSPSGEYELVSGIGVFLKDGRKPIEIGGLPPGDYKFELKEAYSSSTAYWTLENVVVKKGATTRIKDQPIDFKR